MNQRAPLRMFILKGCTLPFVDSTFWLSRVASIKDQLVELQR